VGLSAVTTTERERKREGERRQHERGGDSLSPRVSCCSVTPVLLFSHSES